MASLRSNRPNGQNVALNQVPMAREPSVTRGSQFSKSTNRVSQGDLEEVDLSLRPSSNSDKPGSLKPKKPRVRLDRFGRPFPPRKPRHGLRTEDDKARDALVEEILHEAPFDNIYSESGSQANPKTEGVTPGQDEAADERIAEEFKKEFLANQHRNVPRQSGPPGSTSKQGADVKGPKLGGSRSQRAAMRAMEEKAAKGKK